MPSLNLTNQIKGPMVCGIISKALQDIRTERAFRACIVYASCLSIYFFWNYAVRIAPGIVEVTPSELYWAILMVRNDG